MNTKEIIADKFEIFVQIIKMFMSPTDQFLNEITTDPNTAVEAIDDLYSKIRSEVESIKYDITNKNRINIDYLVKVRDAKAELVCIRKKLIEKIDEETQTALDLIAQIEQM